MFVALGMVATGLGSTLRDNRDLLNKIAGALIIAMGLLFVALAVHHAAERRVAPARAHRPRRQRRPDDRRRGVRDRLDAVHRPDAHRDPQRRGGQGHRRARARALLAVYSAGLAIPFLISAVAFHRATARLPLAARPLRRHHRGQRASILIVMGILIFTGEMTQLNVEAQRFLEKLGLDALYTL